ncbi:MAG: dTDP-4-amino-4,6-dideoxygalactose transaminase [Planctomycetota bacterium]
MAEPTPIPFHLSDLGPEEAVAAAECVRSGLIAGDGALGQKAEEVLCEITGSAHALLVTSATHALELSVAALDIGPGDEVICPSFAFPSTANCILQRGATPVFADIDAATLNLDPEDVARVATPKTRAVMPVDYAGIGCEVEALREAGASGGATRPVSLIEDAAQGMDAYRGDAHLGTAADAGALSFHATKNITCGEGGALLLRDEEDHRRAEIIREKGTNRAEFMRGEIPKYEWVGQGSSYVLSDILAAVLLVQLDKLPELTARRLEIKAAYDAAFADLAAAGTLRLQVEPADAKPNAHIYSVRTRDEPTKAALRAHLGRLGVPAPFHFVPLHTTSFAVEACGTPRDLPVTADTWRTLLRLPIHPSLTDDQVQRVIDAVTGMEWPS